MALAEEVAWKLDATSRCRFCGGVGRADVTGDTPGHRFCHGCATAEQPLRAQGEPRRRTPSLFSAVLFFGGAVTLLGLAGDDYRAATRGALALLVGAEMARPANEEEPRRRAGSAPPLTFAFLVCGGAAALLGLAKADYRNATRGALAFLVGARVLLC
jgi:hypothetical protein